jgi:hypothetical protein
MATDGTYVGLSDTAVKGIRERRVEAPLLPAGAAGPTATMPRGSRAT